MKISAPRGTYDLLPDETRRWQAIEKELRAAAALYGYGEIRFPMYEHTELFLRGMGETGDVVQKEMFTFEDRGGRSLTLRPEGTASVVRAFIEHGLHMSALPFKCYYIAPNFRYEKPQKGRFHQHVQFGAECFGASAPQADAEIIALAHTILDKLVGTLELRINSIGCKECRPVYQQTLKSWLGEKISQICETCRTRMERNPMRVLDCKAEACAAAVKDAPAVTDCLCTGCADFIGRLEGLLEDMAIPFTRDPRLVRGFDYYTGTVFEFVSEDIGAQGTVCGGGRYDGLVEELGGPPTPALGFGMGMERLLMSMIDTGTYDKPIDTDVYIAPMGTGELCSKLCAGLRRIHISAQTDLCGRSVKAQMKYADKIGARYTAVIGENELEKGEMVLKNMQTGKTVTCKLEAEHVKNIILR
jgi:histidyl-tRNA synthetase